MNSVWMLKIHLSLEEFLSFEAHSCFCFCFFKQIYIFQQENVVLEKNLPRLGKGQCPELCKWPGWRLPSEFPLSALPSDNPAIY